MRLLRLLATAIVATAGLTGCSTSAPGKPVKAVDLQAATSQESAAKACSDVFGTPSEVATAVKLTGDDATDFRLKTATLINNQTVACYYTSPALTTKTHGDLILRVDFSGAKPTIDTMVGCARQQHAGAWVYAIWNAAPGTFPTKATRSQIDDYLTRASQRITE